ncbi:sensor histidine kinase [Paenibacillus mendelii]|uniref:histidine kinase n=1 Tax=Paenibacillus mendelii TaxID=206163 RepID=A0ABV6JEH3_9BACL|nr:HAMP domain-containing sensor histidine kinase [Paenibacillus mendelii]MCQ6557085.1 HAMP domain-containing histidine kinase [Paenibacillus mendelii]
MSAERIHRRAVSTVPLLRYWTWRYTLLLLVLLAIIGILGVGWIRENAIKQQFEVLEARTELLAAYYSKSLDEILTEKPTDPSAPVVAIPMVPAISRDLFVQIYELDSGVLRSEGQKPPNDEPPQNKLPPKANKPERTKEIITGNHGKWLRVGVPYYRINQFAGKYYVGMSANNSFENTYLLILTAIGLIAISGWMVVYILSRTLTKPLRELALAAGQISNGNYKPDLPDMAQIKEEEIHTLVRSFDEMTTRLDQLERMRTDLLANVSHELRTPVTSIRGMIQAVKDGVVTGTEADEFMQLSMNEAKRLQMMVNELLDFTAMETDRIQIKAEKVVLIPLVSEIVAQLRILPIFASVKLRVDGASPGLIWTGDRMHLKQILINLLNNSAASGAGCISITICQTGEGIQIDVADDGNGIDPEEAPFIFERYYRGDSRRKKKRGLGLGLPICRLLAKANGGQVELLQTSHAGSVFRITLNAKNS